MYERKLNIELARKHRKLKLGGKREKSEDRM